MRGLQKRCQIEGAYSGSSTSSKNNSSSAIRRNSQSECHRLPNDEAAHPGGINGNDGGEVDVDVLTLDVNASAHSLELHHRGDLVIANEARHLEHIGIVFRVELELPAVGPAKQSVASPHILFDMSLKALEHQCCAAFRLRANPIEVVGHVFLRHHHSSSCSNELTPRLHDQAIRPREISMDDACDFLAGF